MIKHLLLFSLSALFALSSKAQSVPGSVPYNWKNVQISGGGFVDEIIFHPAAKDVRYCRTDMGRQPVTRGTTESVIG